MSEPNSPPQDPWSSQALPVPSPSPSSSSFDVGAYSRQPPAQPQQPQHNIAVHPQVNVVVNHATQPAYIVKQKNLGAAYAWWLLLGIIGAHHFYLGRPGRGMLYLFTFGILLLGWFIDAVTLPTQVRRINARGY